MIKKNPVFSLALKQLTPAVQTEQDVPVRNILCLRTDSFHDAGTVDEESKGAGIWLALSLSPLWNQVC